MPRHCSHGIEFKRQVAREFIAGETLHGLAKAARKTGLSVDDKGRPVVADPAE